MVALHELSAGEMLALYRAKALGRNRTLAHSELNSATDPKPPVSRAKVANTAAVQAK